MARLLTTALLLSLAASASVAASANLLDTASGFLWGQEFIDVHEDESAAIGSFLSEMGAGSRQDQFYLLTRFMIRPSQHKEFMDKWVEVKKEMVHGVKGAQMFKLGRILNTNIAFINCEAWESKDLFLQHMKKEGSAVRKFMDWLNENDIVFFFTEMEPIAHIKPAKEDFLDGVKQLASSIEKEGEADAYCAARDLATNDRFLTFTAFDSKRKLESHLESRHVLKWKKFVDDENIVYRTFLLKLVENVGDEQIMTA